MMAIAKKEGLQLTDATMRSLVEGANGDLRLILGQLQMIRLRTAALSYDDAKKHGANSKAKTAACAPQHAGVLCFQSKTQVQITCLTSNAPRRQMHVMLPSISPNSKHSDLKW